MGDRLWVIVLLYISIMLRHSVSFLSKPSFRCNPNRFLSQAGTKTKAKAKPVSENKYSATVFLPQTTFEQRANAVRKEPEIQKWWEEKRIYDKLSETNPGDVFVLHDGPPYANGDLHIGHALNKILKDFINRYNILQGKKVRFVPGWDCHGLPIELKVLQSIKGKEREALTPLELRKKAAEFAEKTMESQRESFKRYGVWGDWDSPYLTLQPEYEAAQIRVFGEMVQNGHIYRGKKPVHWSPSSRTALAEAELEYPDNHISRSIFVGFKAVALPPSASAKLGHIDDLRVAIWTTTPWTIPANLAVVVNAHIKYSVVSHPAVLNGAHLIVAEDLISSLASKCGLETDTFSVTTSFLGKELEGLKYQHPLYERLSEIVIGGDYITTESGTGLVHTAPGHGQEDYQTGLKYGLPLLSPVDDSGRFTKEAGERFEGKDVLSDGNVEVINALKECGALIKEEPYNHKYPYDWRTKKPTIFRATEQWFASVSNFKDSALEAIDTVKWIPQTGRNRIATMVEGRGDWCISRQRSWGVPIPVFYRKSDNEPLLTQETLAHIESVFRNKGSDAWWELEVKDLLPPSMQHLADEYHKGHDTMDVWFDSGTSWAGVCKARSDRLRFPADMYLEGSDQSRGWFQSSLLTSVASQGQAPYKTVLTHGFVLDEKGHKMSKSLGNVVDPLMVIQGGSNQKEHPPYGADTLRMWVSSVDYSGDVCIGANIMRQVSDNYRKLRNTIRFLLGSLNDFDPKVDAVKYEALADVDKYMLGSLTKLTKEIEQAYSDNQFYRIVHLLQQFTSGDLSAFYLDISKDRLYISSKENWRRRSCQTTIDIISKQLFTMIAPILPHLAEEAWKSLPYTRPVESIFEKRWMQEKEHFPEHDEAWWTTVKKIRLDVNKAIELSRQAKLVGASMESAAHIFVQDATIRQRLNELKGDEMLLKEFVSTNGVDDLRLIFMVSQVHIVDNEKDILNMSETFVVPQKESESGFTIGITKAKGVKCERCWYYSESVGHDHEHVDICPRCASEIRANGQQVM